MLTAKTRARFVRFFVVGGVGFLVQIGSLRLLKGILPANIAFTIAFVLSVASHYTFNRFWALTSTRRDTGRQFLEYLGTVGVSYLVSLTAFNIALRLLKVGVMWSTVLSVPPSTIVVFLLLNYRVFHHRPEPANASRGGAGEV
jgi:putative flippase GtrA